MAAGDIINFSSNGATSFTPAATVEIMILNVLTDTGAGRWGFVETSTGTITEKYGSTTNNAAGGGSTLCIGKYGITNAFPFRIFTSASVGFSGIQIK
jgi:hypothetical protein